MNCEEVQNNASKKGLKTIEAGFETAPPLEDSQERNLRLKMNSTS